MVVLVKVTSKGAQPAWVDAVNPAVNCPIEGEKTKQKQNKAIETRVVKVIAEKKF